MSSLLVYVGVAWVLAAGAVAAVPQADYYVSPAGNDAWSGTRPEPNAAGTDGPFATIERARDAARQVTDRPLTVLIAGGRYQLRRPLRFGPEDSRPDGAPVTYAAMPGARPVFSGGRVIRGWRRGPGALWTTTISAVQRGGWQFRQLFVDGRRATRARSPNEGYYQMRDLVAEDKAGEHTWTEGVTRFLAHPGEVRAWEDIGQVEAVIYHSWETSRIPLAAVDETTGLVVLAGKTQSRPFAWDPQQRYYIENAPDALDRPGEWRLDRSSGVLSYWPLPGEDMTRAEVIAPELDALVVFDGDPAQGRWVRNLRLCGLTFEHADQPLPPDGHRDPQAAVSVPAAVMATGALDCVIEDCEIRHVGMYGLWLRAGCKRCRVERTHIHDLGAGGLRIGERIMATEDVAEASHNVVHNNYIHDGGHIYPAGVGIWVAQSGNNIISHNEIHSFNYTGISLGWTWSAAPSRTLNNLVEKNHIHHVMRGVLSDGGGIYTLGTQTGTVLRSNLIHDVFPYMGKPPMAWGIYFDQGSNGITVEDNIVYNTLTGGIMNTGQFGNTVRNNIFAFSAWHAAWRYKRTEGQPTRVERNIFYLTQGELFHADAGASDTESVWDYNLYWRTDGKPLLFYEDSFTQWQARGLDLHSRVADPRFVDAQRYDFRLRPDSPALELGFRPIDASDVGLVGDGEWVNLPRQVNFAPTKLPPPPPPPAPITFADDFEDTPVGQPARLAVTISGGGAAAIAVTDEVAASGRHSLKFTDAAGLTHIFNPHLYYQPHLREGVAVASFDLRIEPGAEVAIEWRDAAQPYRVGPSLRISGGTLRAGPQPLLDLPCGAWVHCAVTCALGALATGTYDIAVRVPGGEEQRCSQLPCGSREFNRLEWLGFVSLADAPVVFYLDNVQLQLQR